MGRLIDAYLAEVALDENLKCSQFQAIVALVPEYARLLDDGIYRAIDIYLKRRETNFCSVSSWPISGDCSRKQQIKGQVQGRVLSLLSAIMTILLFKTNEMQKRKLDELYD